METVTHFNTSMVNQMTRNTGDRVWKFYGLFQLTNGLTCSDDTAQLPNICGANCTGESALKGQTGLYLPLKSPQASSEYFPLYFDLLFRFLSSLYQQHETARCV